MTSRLLTEANPKILIAFGTRPELIKLAPLIKKIESSERRTDFLLVSTSQHTELLNEQLAFWDIKPDIILPARTESVKLARLLTTTLSGLQDVIEQFDSIEYILVQGDTNTALACSHLAFLNQKKLVHVEAGLRTHDLLSPFPEEYNRMMVARAAYFHFVPSEKNRRNLIQEGCKDQQIMITGNTVIDALKMSFVKAGITMETQNERRDVIVTLHRRENAAFIGSLIGVINELKVAFPDLNFIWVTHPNYSFENLMLLAAAENIRIVEHLPYTHFIRMYQIAPFVITDSGGITEEASQLGIPVVVFRKLNDRSEPLDMGHAMIVSMQSDEIMTFFAEHIHRPVIAHEYFGNGKASGMIYDWIMSELYKTSRDVPQKFNTVIIGGGPAGTGPVLKSMLSGTFEQFAEGGLALVEASGNLVNGSITQYLINSDTASEVFMECLQGDVGDYLNLKQLDNDILDLKAYAGRPVPLPLLDPFLSKLGSLLENFLSAQPECQLYMNTEATQVIKLDAGGYRVELNNGLGLECTHVIFAAGGSPVRSLAAGASFAEKVDLDPFRHKSITADALLRGREFKLPASPKIVILGASHSAFSSADYLLKSKIDFSADSIRIWGARSPKLFFPSADDAFLHGYTNFSAHDICPTTGRVFRLAGLRMDGRQLYMNMLGIGDRVAETRVTLSITENNIERMQKDLSEADLIVHALGYQFNMLPLKGEDNLIINVSDSNGRWVNERCQLLDSAGNVIEGLYATGLASGYIPSGNAGGEPSFSAQTNGFWYYQNVVADLILQNIIQEVAIGDFNPGSVL